jgi:RNA polymerase sigma factor (sigma-70 family)
MDLRCINDASLVALCAEGAAGEPALAELVRRYGPLVLQTITWIFRRHCPAREAETQDVFQEVFVSLFKDNRRGLRKFDPGKAALGTYLAAIAKYASLNVLGSARKGMVELTDSIVDETAQTESDTERSERLGRIGEALAECTPNERLLHHLYFEEFMPPEAVAAVLDVTVESVYAKKAKLIEKIKMRMGPALREG